MQRELPILLSPSRAEAASRCHRRHAVSNILCYEPAGEPTSPHLLFGTAIHEGAAAWWKERDQDAAVQAVRDHWEASIERDSKLTQELAEFMVRHYTSAASIAGQHWASDDENWELVVCEERIELPLGKATLTFKVDRLVRNKNCDPAQYVLVDTKTTSRITRWWTRRWPTSLQQKLYAAAVEEHFGISLSGHFIEGLLKKVPTEIKYVELDWPCEVLQEALGYAAKLAERDAKLIALAGEQGADGCDSEVLKELVLTESMTNGDDCWSFNRKCELFELCHETPPEMRKALFDAEFEHVEPEWLE